MTFYPNGSGAGQTSPALPPPGWYPDPHNANHDRYWDGARWTHHTQVRPAAIVKDPPGQQAGQQQAGQQQTGQQQTGQQQTGQQQTGQQPQQAAQPQQQAAQEPKDASGNPWQVTQATAAAAHEPIAHTPESHHPSTVASTPQSAGQAASTAPATQRLPERGWLPDPSEIQLERYWDGNRWTIHTRDRVTKVEHAPPAAYAYRPGEWAAQPQSRGGALKVWGIVGLSVLVVLVAVVAIQFLNRLGEPSRLADSPPVPDSWAPEDTWEASLPEPPAFPDLDPFQTTPEQEPVHQTTPADIDYPVFGSTELVTFLEAGMIAQDQTIDVSSWVQGDGLDTVGEALIEAGTQNPYLYVSGWETMQQGSYVEVRPAYIYSDAEAERRRSETVQAASRGLANAGVASNMSDKEKVTLIHDYIVDHAEYDVGAFDAIEDGEITPRVHQSQEAYGILVMGTAVCNGYAMAFSAMAEQAGIETVTVTGSDTAGATGGSHAWNKVLIDDQWLLVDVTWNDPVGWDGGALRDYLLITDDDPILATRIIGDDWVVSENLGAYSSRG